MAKNKPTASSRANKLMRERAPLPSPWPPSWNKAIHNNITATQVSCLSSLTYLLPLSLPRSQPQPRSEPIKNSPHGHRPPSLLHCNHTQRARTRMHGKGKYPKNAVLGAFFFVIVLLPLSLKTCHTHTYTPPPPLSGVQPQLHSFTAPPS